MDSSWITEYNSLSELKEDFKDNALALFALWLRFGIDDLKSVGIDAITDGAQDKKLDMVYINAEDHFAVVSQCYFSSKQATCAKANKASDLNTALVWLLQMDISDIPKQIKSATINLRNEIKEGNINKLYIWYVHNLPESDNIKKELSAVNKSLDTILADEYGEIKIATIVEEVGKNTLQEWYESCKTPIIMNEEVSFDINGGYDIKEKNWVAYSTAIKARDIARLYKKHQNKLFSANIRDYLGSRNSNSNINNGIKQTIDQERENFWVYNNGITLLTNRFKVHENKITLSGMSIVNGAQTTGAIGSNKKLPENNALIHVRIIEVTNKRTDLIEKIIRYNNSQNQVEAADFRSTDKIQIKLKKEFDSIKYAKYEAGRRGSSTDKIKRKSAELGSYYVGQALTAFHGDPITAYNKKREIWSNNTLYNRAFNESTSAEHIIFCCTLIKAIENIQLEYKKKTSLTPKEEENLSFLRKRGAKYLFAYAVSYCIEKAFFKRTNIYTIYFNNITSLNDALSNWYSVLKVLVPFCTNSLNQALSNGLKNTKEIDNGVKNFLDSVSAFLNVAPDDTIKNFISKIKC